MSDGRRAGRSPSAHREKYQTRKRESSLRGVWEAKLDLMSQCDHARVPIPDTELTFIEIGADVSDTEES